MLFFQKTFILWDCFDSPKILTEIFCTILRNLPCIVQHFFDHLSNLNKKFLAPTLLHQFCNSFAFAFLQPRVPHSHYFYFIHSKEPLVLL